MVRLAAILLSAACLPMGAQTAPASAGKPVDISGTVGQIHIVAREGMPYLELRHGAEATRVYLGPMPFLIAENFNPKTGQQVTVKGYKVEDWVLAAQVTFVAEKRTVTFRDERGWPVWRGGFGRGARRNR